jgi:hypothetical protein
MKKLTLILIMTVGYLTAIAQTSSKEIGLWQAKLNGSILKAKDMGYTDPQYANYMLFYIFQESKAYFVMAENKTKVTKANLPNLLKKQLGGEGTYTLYDNLESMPEKINAKFSLYIPYEEGSKFLEATIQGEPMSFIFNPEKRVLKGMNPEINFELMYLGPF